MPEPEDRVRPRPDPARIRRGVGLAAAAALAFGGTTPFVAWASAGAGPFASAALLYGGSALAALTFGGRGAALSRRHTRFLVPMVLFGSVLAPAAYVAGFARAGATATSLVVNAEAPFTVLLAAVALGERFGVRVALALAAMVLGGGCLVLEDGAVGEPDPVAVGLAFLAPLGWAIDNVLARKLAEVPAFDVVASKGALGALVSGAVALALGEPGPTTLGRTGALVLLGAIGYGLSLRLFLGAQAQIGAGRTSSVFAIAPFLGAALSALGGAHAPGWPTALAAVLFAIGVVLHATEPEGPDRT